MGTERGGSWPPRYRPAPLSREGRDSVIVRLSRLGWTDREVGETVGLAHNRISQIWSEFSELKKVTKNLLTDGHPHTEVAERLSDFTTFGNIDNLLV